MQLTILNFVLKENVVSLTKKSVKFPNVINLLTNKIYIQSSLQSIINIKKSTRLSQHFHPLPVTPHFLTALPAFRATYQQWSFVPYLMSLFLSRTYTSTTPLLHPTLLATLPNHHRVRTYSAYPSSHIK